MNLDAVMFIRSSCLVVCSNEIFVGFHGVNGKMLVVQEP